MYFFKPRPTFEDILTLVGNPIREAGWEEEGTYKMKKVSSKKRYAKTIIYFRVDTRLMDLIDTLKRFYSSKTKNKLLPYLLIMSILDIAALKPKPDWTKHQRHAHKKARKYASELGQAITVTAAKQILSEITKRKPGTKMTVSNLGKKTKKKIEKELKK